MLSENNIPKNVILHKPFAGMITKPSQKPYYYKAVTIVTALIREKVCEFLTKTMSAIQLTDRD